MKKTALVWLLVGIMLVVGLSSGLACDDDIDIDIDDDDIDIDIDDDDILFNHALGDLVYEFAGIEVDAEGT